jgi:hypothetical protein
VALCAVAMAERITVRKASETGERLKIVPRGNAELGS